MIDGNENQGPVVDPIQEALQRFTSKREQMDEQQKRELVNRTGTALHTIIESPRQTTDPLAYSLVRVVREDGKKYSTLRYYLRPPEAIQLQSGIDMISLRRSMYEEKGQVKGNYVIGLHEARSDDHPQEENPYSITSRYLSSVSIAPESEKEQRFFIQCEEVYKGIQTHGIRKSLDEMVMIHKQKSEPLDILQRYITSLPFTGSLSASSAEQVQAQDDEVANEVAAKWRAEYEQREAAREQEAIARQKQQEEGEKQWKQEWEQRRQIAIERKKLSIESLRMRFHDIWFLRLAFVDKDVGRFLKETIKNLDQATLELYALEHPEEHISPDEMYLHGTAVPKEGKWMHAHLTPSKDVYSSVNNLLLGTIYKSEPSSSPIEPGYLLLPKWQIDWENGGFVQTPADLENPASEVVLWGRRSS